MKTAPRIAGIVLAAGASRRMGSVNKLLARVGETPVILGTINVLTHAGVSPIIVVTGHMRQELETLVAPVFTVYNPRHEEGMGTSLAVGAAALPEKTDGFLVALGDMPAVRSSTIERLAKELSAGGPSAICVPTFDGNRGNPVLFGRSHQAALALISGDRGARNFIATHPDYVREVPVLDEGILRDIDTPADLAEANEQGLNS